MKRSSWEKFINDIKFSEKVILIGIVDELMLEDFDFKKVVRGAKNVDESRIRKLKNVTSSKIIFETNQGVSNLDRRGRVYVKCVDDVRFYIIKTKDMNIIYYVNKENKMKKLSLNEKNTESRYFKSYRECGYFYDETEISSFTETEEYFIKFIFDENVENVDSKIKNVISQIFEIDIALRKEFKNPTAYEEGYPEDDDAFEEYDKEISKEEYEKANDFRFDNGMVEAKLVVDLRNNKVGVLDEKGVLRDISNIVKF